MTDIQTWRRNTHLSASRIADLAGYGSSPEDISLSTSPNEYTRPRLRPRRSLASFASYLGANRTASGDKSEWPSIDWSHIDANDHVYRPELDSMCTTLQHHVSNNPSTGLPAQYNSFVLHVLESYHKLKDDKKDLERKLQVEEERHRTDVDELNLTIQSLLTTSEASIPITAVPGSSVKAGDMLAGSPEKTRKSSSKLDSLLSKFDAGYSRKHKRFAKGLGTQTTQGDSIVATQTELVRPSSPRSGNDPAVVAPDPNHHITPPSPPPPTTRVKSLNVSSTEGDSTSDEDYPVAFASIATAAADFSNKGRFHTQQFEYRNDRQSNAALSEPLGNQRNSAGAHKDEGSSPIATMPPESTSVTNRFPDSNKASGLRQLRIGPVEDADHSLDEMGHRRVHRREFSFLPGDDSRSGQSRSLVIKPEHFPDRASARLVDSKTERSEQDMSVKATSDIGNAIGIASSSGSYSQLGKIITPLAEEEKTGKLPHRDGSGKSVLTAIREGLSRSSSYSYQGSFSSDDGNVSLTGGRKDPRDKNFAVAAARAAKKRQAESKGRTNG